MFRTFRVRQLHGFEVQPNVADIIGTFLQIPLTGPRRGVGRGEAGVPDVSSVPGYCSPAGAGGEQTAAPEPSSAGAGGLSSLANTLSLKQA